MARKRGVFEQDDMPGRRTFGFRMKDGTIAFSITLNLAVFPNAKISRVLRHLVRALLDPIDPPLSLACGGGGEPEAPPHRVRVPDDPYRAAPLGLV